jgi:L-threonylcarbamoyladenylate synthase
MIRVRVDPVNPEPGAIARAADVIRAGGLVAFPTETVYGLGANALDDAAVRRVFQAKGRPAHNPLIAHVADVDGARRLVRDWPANAARLAAAFWPGPLTLVLPRADEVPDIVTAGLRHVAVRIPAHPVALALLRTANLPVVAPSANPSTAISPTTADHVARHLGNRAQMILDAGPTRLGIESTVLDVSREPPVLLRPGALSAQRIEEVVGGLAPPAEGPAIRHASPGLMERHYAPRAALVLFPPERRLEAADLAASAAADGQTVGALLLLPLDAPLTHVAIMPRDAAAYARELYAELHRLDDAGCHIILAEHVPDEPDWEGVRDRLRRASAPGFRIE